MLITIFLSIRTRVNSSLAKWVDSNGRRNDLMGDGDGKHEKEYPEISEAGGQELLTVRKGLEE
ncbi:hypothetical protein CCR94_21755 [Rhodoblastus sphagnicola]|uniref:Uncharacterized protein n=1 Tax=Rhodoblastus sphagnicola TaxID=333368 RepID=A0A2S6MWJ7_9HYPH|nr:hypothetical protein [Rhodoblastus sphagnicola]MBB4200023.1 hypothetical protein [Rhodoblastus sphagnicola]PPQ26735.1 hypothetical protein CCR94_21755 [Rhodoblastus sphagnicola]